MPDLNGSPIVRALIEVPSSGAWWADLEVSDPGLSSGTDATMTLGSSTWVGRVVSARRDGGSVRARVVAGRGGLSARVPSTWYRSGGLTLAGVLESILAPSGEVLGDVPDIALGTWQTYGRPTYVELDALASETSTRWAIGVDGRVSFESVDTIRTAVPPGLLREASETVLVYAAPRGPDTTRPPCKIDAVTARHVRIAISKSDASQRYVLEVRETAEVGPNVVRVGRITSQSGDTCDVRLDDGWDLSSIPLWSGVPGMSVDVDPGTEVMVWYASGDPRHPHAMLSPLSSSPASSVTIRGKGLGPATPVVRAGDKIVVVGQAPGELTILSVQSALGSRAVLKVGDE